MREYGGFEHNLQSLTIVDELEQHYGSFNGLNLCFETREGILKHCSRENASQLGELGKRFLDGGQPLIEAQIANLADEIAYNNHDIDDGLRSGLLTFEQLAEVELWRTHHESVLAAHPTLANSIRGPHSEGERLIHETTRRIINTLIVDLIDTTRATLRQHAPNSPDEVRRCPPLVGYSSEIAEQATQLKRFLFKNLYRHYRVMRMTNKACHVIRSLFDAFSNDNRLLPPAYRATDTTAQTAAQTTTQMRLIAHYIASMTDRYAYQEYRRLFVIGGE
jgi:dGTPase